MLCDNIASSPEFKPEKKRSLREHFNTSEQLQSVDGLKEVLERYHYGENLNFKKINADKNTNYTRNIAAAFVGIGKLFLLSLL